MTAGLGGEEAWRETRYLVFEFAGRRSHWWDRYTGRHRMEGTTEEGAHYVVLENVHDEGKAGRAWLDGEEVAGEDGAKMVENAYAAWVNDTFWLISPYKLRDPGVHLEASGKRTVDGVTYDLLHLSFGDVGLTPGDQYWMFIDPETGLVDRWEYVLESQEPPPTAWEWVDWKRYGAGIMLSSRREEARWGAGVDAGADRDAGVAAGERVHVAGAVEARERYGKSPAAVGGSASDRTSGPGRRRLRVPRFASCYRKGFFSPFRSARRSCSRRLSGHAQEQIGQGSKSWFREGQCSRPK